MSRAVTVKTFPRKEGRRAKVSSSQHGDVHITLERNIKPKDLRNGKVVSQFSQRTRKGRTLVTDFVLTEEDTAHLLTVLSERQRLREEEAVRQAQTDRVIHTLAPHLFRRFVTQKLSRLPSIFSMLDRRAA